MLSMWNLLSNFRIVIPGLIIIVGSLIIVIQHMELKQVTVQRDLARKELEIINIQLNEQNMAIERWHQMAKNEETELREAENKAAEESKRNQLLIQTTLNMPKAKDCQEALNWAASLGPKLAKDWQ